VDILLRLEHLFLPADIPQLLPQIVRRRSLTVSTEGFSVEFATLNPQGFFFYSLYMTAGFIDPDIGSGTVML
jgi:hypothetical protein